MPRKSFLARDKRHVGALQQLLRILAVARRHRNADRGADHHRVAVEQEGIGERLQEAPRQQHRVFRPRHPALHDGEFVGVEAGEHVLLAQCRAQALGHRAQQLVADAVAERVVDRLEIVEAEHQHGDLLGAAPCVREHVVHLLAQQAAVRQAGQGVMLGHEGEPRLGALALGDVHQRQQHRGLIAMDESRGNRSQDRSARRRHGHASRCAPPARRRSASESHGNSLSKACRLLDGQLLEFGAAIAVMFDCGVVDAEDALAIARADDHRHRIAIEQQAERRLALLQFADVGMQERPAAAGGEFRTGEFRTGLGGAARYARDRNAPGFFPWPVGRHLATPTLAFCARSVLRQVSEEMVSLADMRVSTAVANRLFWRHFPCCWVRAASFG